MKKLLLLCVLIMVAASLAFAGLPGPVQTTDVLGAHTIYGRGCQGCHVPHSGVYGNGGTSSDTTSGNIALWGQNLQPLYGQTLQFGDGTNFPVTLPNTGAVAITIGTTMFAPIANPTADTPLWSTMACLSCHDGNIATSSAMKGTTVEQLTINGHTFNAPTLLGNDGTVAGNYHNDHPIGPSAIATCSTWDWDCTYSAGTYSMGPNETIFSSNYLNPFIGVIRNLTDGGDPTGQYVTCTTCHDQHSMTAFKATIGTGTTASHQYVKTSFFLRGYYDMTTGGNNTAQFCRQCHGGEANESHGVYSVPTT